MIDDDGPATLPYGTWPSPVLAETLTERAVSLSLPQIDGTSVYWLESRPEEGGRTALVRRSGDADPVDALTTMPDGSAPDVRSRVHEYGGAAYTVRAGTIVLSHGGDGRLYRLDTGTGAAASAEPVPVALTPSADWRFADLLIDPSRGLVYAVREDHGAGREEPVNELVAVPLDGSAAEDVAQVRVLVTGHDFVSSPSLSHDAAQLAWVTWEHPHMPWTSSRLHVGVLAADGTLSGDDVLAGGDGVSVAQPVWTPGGDLVHVDESSGWWNLYRTEGLADGGEVRTRDLHPSEMEFTPPQWRLGPRTVAVLDEDHLVCSWTTEGRWHLGTVRLANGELEEWHIGWQPVGDVAVSDGRVLVVAASPTRTPAVVEVDLEARDISVLRESCHVRLDPEDVSVAKSISWTAPDGAEAHGFFYPPRSSRFTAPKGELPPLLVMSHGGPTSATHAALSLSVQFWTSRGFAVLDVNYGGSTGYGRAYRERLDGAWGVVDVGDCASGAEHLADSGLVDRNRMAIRGGSAGGFTALAALCFTDVFTAGASLYGVGDLAALARDTHKFESRYTHGLVGPFPQAAALYRDRSPVHHADRLSAPMVLLQGSEDKVVPPNQAEEMAEAVRAKGLPVALVMFDGEAHGFRQAENIQAAVLAELSFYAQVWGFEPAGDVPKLAVENLP